MAHLTVHYHELSLKRGNRKRFENVLRRNIRRALHDLGPCRIAPAAGRLLVETEGDADEAVDRLCRVAGVAYVLRVRRLPRDLDKVGEAIAADLKTRPDVGNFRITARRVDKSFPLISQEIDRDVGAVVNRETGLPVRLKGADAEVHVTVMDDEILVGFDKRQGPGGLPAGTGGRVAVLLSGGFDSPVAAWRVINRGCRADLIHFHSHPLVDKTTQEKARDLA
ncbi:MAG: tRNA 4-thiouridine(8) synthase ThiI, partial [Deltaproteobacteria bacterium]